MKTIQLDEKGDMVEYVKIFKDPNDEPIEEAENDYLESRALSELKGD